MYCSDCHGVEISSYNNEPAVRGVHGSANADILKGWWAPGTGLPDTGLAATQKLINDYNSFLCFRCHDEQYYGGWGGTITLGSHFAHNAGSANKDHQVPCWACHGRKVHGKNRYHLVSLESDEDAGYVFSVLDSYTHAATPIKGNCTTSGGSMQCSDYVRRGDLNAAVDH